MDLMNYLRKTFTLLIVDYSDANIVLPYISK